MKPGDLGLPHPEWRRFQEEALLELACSDKRFLLLEAPTGSGKSAIAAGWGRLVGERTIILTSQRTLQTQYVESLPGLVKMEGRANFPCVLDAGRTAAEGICTIGGKCDHKGMPSCPYYHQKGEAADAPEAVLNYQLWLALANHAHQFTPRDCLVADEAHLVEEEVRRFASATFRKSQFRTLDEPWPAPAWHRWAASFRDQNSRRYSEATWRAGPGLSPSAERQARALRAVYEAACLLADRDCAADNWVAEEYAWGTVFRPVWVSRLVPKYIFPHATKILFCSATILDKDLFCQQLGLPPDDTAFIRTPSTFPVKNRPLYYKPVGKVKGNDDGVLADLVQEVDRILDEHPGRGLVHTTSYRLAAYLLGHSRHIRRLLTHSATDKADVLVEFKARPGAVLVSPSVTTGVDLPYDLCEFQVIAKLAFPNLGDKQIKQRMKTGPDGLPNPKGQGWYNWVTACSLVQAYGRGMRFPDDNCVTYLLDGNWGWFRHTVKGMLPAWFTEAIKTVREPGTTVKVDDLLKQFSKIA